MGIVLFPTSSSWDYLKDSGIVSDACYPYTSGGGQTAACYTTCPGGGSWEKYYAKMHSSFYTADMIKNAVYHNGPIQTGFIVYSDFMSYHSGVYRHVSRQQLGGHAVKIVGWGNSGSTPYWIV